MDVWVAVVWCVLVSITGLAVLITAIKQKRLFRTVIVSAVEGVCAVAAVNVAGAFTGISLGLNTFSLVCCAIGGVPAAVSLLLTKCIFQI